jgi:hypothetical protein
MNDKKSEYDKARANLLKSMDDCGVTSLSVASPSLVASINQPDQTIVDVEQAMYVLFPQIGEVLKSMSDTDRNRFLGVLSITQTAVTDNFGKSVLAKITTTKKGTRNVTVKAQ